MSFEMVINMSGSGTKMDTTSKMYISDKKFRMESEMMGIKSITIVNDKGETYMYDQNTNTAMKIASVTNSETPSNWYKDPSSMKVVGEEKKNGVDCLVVTMAQSGISSKLWLSKDTGMPVYTEQTMSQGLVTADFKNFKIGPQPASLFEIPAGAKITTMDIPNTPAKP
jgi:outer membrane lipoprotein-sorting protein